MSARSRSDAGSDGGPAPGIAGWVPRMVVLDLDGTVVENDGTVARRDVVAAVAVARDAGAYVVVATGRALTSTFDVAHSLGLSDAVLVCSNGAVVYDGAGGAPTYVASLDPGPPARALAEHLPEAHFAVEVGLEGFLTTVGFRRDFPAVYLGTGTFEELLTAPTPRLVVRGEDGHDAAGIRRAGELALGAAYGWWTGHSAWIDVTVRGVSKASGLARVAADLGVHRHEVLGIGDGWNDVEMLAWAGWGVAMGHAPPGVRDQADDVTGAVAEGGAAQAIRRFFR